MAFQEDLYYETPNQIGQRESRVPGTLVELSYIREE